MQKWHGNINRPIHTFILAHLAKGMLAFAFTWLCHPSVWSLSLSPLKLLGQMEQNIAGSILRLIGWCLTQRWQYFSHIIAASLEGDLRYKVSLFLFWLNLNTATKATLVSDWLIVKSFLLWNNNGKWNELDRKHL